MEQLGLIGLFPQELQVEQESEEQSEQQAPTDKEVLQDLDPDLHSSPVEVELETPQGLDIDLHLEENDVSTKCYHYISVKLTSL